MKKSQLSGFTCLLASAFMLAGCSSLSAEKNGQTESSASTAVSESSEDTAVSAVREKREPRAERINMRNKEGYEVVPSLFTMIDDFRIIPELTARAEVIVKGKVVKNEYIEHEGIIFTISEAEISELLGNSSSDTQMEAGSTLKLLQTGGIYGQRDAGGDEKNEDQKFEYTNGEFPVLKEGAEAVLFLEKYEGPIGDDLFVALGDYQGRFIAESDDYIEPQSENILSASGNKDFTLGELKEEIAGALSSE